LQERSLQRFIAYCGRSWQNFIDYDKQHWQHQEQAKAEARQEKDHEWQRQEEAKKRDRQEDRNLCAWKAKIDVICFSLKCVVVLVVFILVVLFIAAFLWFCFSGVISSYQQRLGVDAPVS
jgi:hypothetical protein